ncbi:LysR family transcriptional regulator [Acrocarpospora catenulata]|uniref:LysR family transcriptional regulator n=1 Tax=Acrocarpospora catenulata TaxID=2836182 RepID=UPI001BDB063E|nr:LysR family transcriptional regulator [Acrocarpospora catenulata]
MSAYDLVAFPSKDRLKEGAHTWGMDLNLRLVRYFVAVAEEMHFGRAAARLFIAQPSLSTQIRRLEQELGTPLLSRNTRKVELTPAGERFLEAARKLLAAAQDAVYAAAGDEPLRIASIVDGLDTVPLILRTLRRQRPSLEVVHGIAGMIRQIAEVRAGRLDLAVGLFTEQQTELEAEVIRLDPVRLVLREDHPLAAHGEIPVSRLDQCRWVFGNSDHTPDWVEFVLAFLAEAGVRPRPPHSGQTPLSSMLEQVREWDAVAAWPESCPPPGAGLVVRPIVHPSPVYPWSLVWRPDRMSDRIRAFQSAARTTAADSGWLTDPFKAETRHGDHVQQ